MTDKIYKLHNEDNRYSYENINQNKDTISIREIKTNASIPVRRVPSINVQIEKKTDNLNYFHGFKSPIDINNNKITLTIDGRPIEPAYTSTNGRSDYIYTDTRIDADKSANPGNNKKIDLSFLIKMDNTGLKYLTINNDNTEWKFTTNNPIEKSLSKGGKSVTSKNSLDKCTVAELKEKAIKRGIKVSGLKKSEIILKLRK